MQMCNGLALVSRQWGTIDTGKVTSKSIPLNIAYKNNYNGVCVDNGNYPSQNAIWSFKIDSLSAFTLSAYWPVDKTFNGGIVHWITIGA